MIDNETLLNDEYPFSLPPKTVVGYRENGRPIYNIAGGSEDVTVSESDDEVESDDSDDDDDDAKDADAWTPPTREVWEKTVAAKQKADSEAAARKRYLRDAGLDPKTGKPIEKPTLEIDLEDDVEDVVQQDETPKKDDSFSREKLEKLFERNLEREVAKTEQRVRGQVVPLISAVPTALDDAGWNGKNLPRMLKLLDLEAVSVDSDGDIEGLTEQIDELKKDFPEFFKRSRMKDVAKDVADASTVGAGKKKAPSSEEEQDFKSRMKNQILHG